MAPTGLASGFTHRRQHCFGLGPPERHVHGAVEGNGGGQRRAGLLPLAGLGVQRAEAVLAVRLERAHAELVSQSAGLLVVGFGLYALRRLAPRRNVAEKAQGVRLAAPLLVLTGERQRMLGEGVRLLQAASQQLRLPQGETTERLIGYRARSYALPQRPRGQRHGIGDAPGQGVRRPQGRSYPGEHDREVRILTDAYGPFEPGESPGQVALAEGHQTDPPRGNHKARGVRHRLGNPQPLFAESPALGECSQLGMAPGEVDTGAYGW